MVLVVTAAGVGLGLDGSAVGDGAAAGVGLGLAGESRGLPVVAGWLWLIPGVAGHRAEWHCGGLAQKEGVRCTRLPFITTGRGQGSLGQVPDSGTKVLHHRVKLGEHHRPGCWGVSTPVWRKVVMMHDE